MGTRVRDDLRAVNTVVLAFSWEVWIGWTCYEAESILRNQIVVYLVDVFCSSFRSILLFLTFIIYVHLLSSITTHVTRVRGVVKNLEVWLIHINNLLQLLHVELDYGLL